MGIEQDTTASDMAYSKRLRLILPETNGDQQDSTMLHGSMGIQEGSQGSGHDEDFLEVDAKKLALPRESGNPHLLAVRGQEHKASDIPHEFGPRLDGDGSEVTDRGNQIYNSLKSQHQAESSGDHVSSDSDDLEVSSMKSEGATESFQERLYLAMKCHPERPKDTFLPKGQLDSLVHKDTVLDELKRLFSGTLRTKKLVEYADLICHGALSQPGKCELDVQIKCYKQIFAILVLIEQQSFILKFIDCGLSDSDLPLQQKARTGRPNTFDLYPKRDDTMTKSLECFDGWSSFFIRAFFENQWKMLAPFFFREDPTNVRNYLLTEHDILPFVDNPKEPSEKLCKTRRGGFGQVRKVFIHPDHHKFNQKLGNVFAIKELYTKDPELWRKEVTVLKRVTAKSHSHITSLLATYEQRGVKYLIFPCARSDLEEYWIQTSSAPKMSIKFVSWVARELRGLASGLATIHQYGTVVESSESSSRTGDGSKKRLFGRHGDIKPRNILLFDHPDDDSDYGTLKLSDFGAAEMNTKKSRSGKPRSKISMWSANYCPPEFIVRLGEVDRKYDIWTLGCLYLEFVTWTLGGYDDVKRFMVERRSSDPKHPDHGPESFFDFEENEREFEVPIIKHQVKEAGFTYSIPN